MADDLAEKAKEALIDDDFEVAINFYSMAIELDANRAEFFVYRAQAHIRLNNFADAISDANKAIELNPSMPKAYLRKGTAYFKLNDYHSAKAALEMGASLSQDNDQFVKLISKCDTLAAGKFGDQSMNQESDVPSLASRQTNSTLSSSKAKYKHDYYQTHEKLVVMIYVKGIPADCVAVDFGEQILCVTIKVLGEDAYCFQPRLFGKVVPDKCTYRVLPTAVEIVLAKAANVNWESLEYSGEISVPKNVSISSARSQRPLYPSSKAKGKDWDKLEAQAKKEEKEEKLDGDAALNKLFQDIYQSADEDARRAMQKSFMESSGTVLSTNWKDVGSKKVEGSAPEGMQIKKWEY